MAQINPRDSKLTQLTAPSQATAWYDLGIVSPSSVDMEVTVASINTDVTFKPQYSDDGVAIVADGEAYKVTNSIGPTNTGNGVYSIPLSPKHKYVRNYFVSETGGTAVTLDTVIAEYTN